MLSQGVRSGFLWWQLDTVYLLIRLVKLFGGIASSRDFKARFLEEQYEPYRRRRARSAEAAPRT